MQLVRDLKVTQDRRNAIYHFLLVISKCSKIVSILHHLRDITTLTVYVTAYDLEKSFSFDKTVKITSHVRFFDYIETISYLAPFPRYYQLFYKI